MVSLKTIQYKKCSNSSNTSKMHGLFWVQLKKNKKCHLYLFGYYTHSKPASRSRQIYPVHFCANWKSACNVKVLEASWPTFMLRTVLYWITRIDFHKTVFSVGASGSFSVSILSVVSSVRILGQMESPTILEASTQGSFITSIFFSYFADKYKLIFISYEESFAASLGCDYILISCIPELPLPKEKERKSYLPKVIRAKATNFSSQWKENSVTCLMVLMGLYIFTLWKKREAK